MTFTKDNSTTEKYKTLPLVATGRNCSRFSLMDFFVSSAATSFWFTSAAFACGFKEGGEYQKILRLD